VVGTAQLSQSNVPDASANSHGPSLRAHMDLVTARFLTVRRRWIKLVVNESLVGIIWLFFLRYWHLEVERRREPSQRLVKPMRPHTTHGWTSAELTSRPVQKERARMQGKRAPTKLSDEGRGMGSHLRKRVNKTSVSQYRAF
jgi:hypothetical protein